LPNRRLRIRQLIPTGQTTSNLVQYVKELVFTNNAGPQAGGSPTVAAENTLKNESDITFQLANAPVITLAHFIMASRQVLDDAPMLASYINGRLLYGLALEEEDELLNGDGSVGMLDGLMHQATAFNRSQAGTKLDWLRRAITQLQLSEYDAEFIVLNPADWEDIELTKDTQGRYIIANPQSLLGPQIWGLPVIPTNSMTASNFLVANGTQAAQIWDRQQAAVELSREDGDNFKKNMVTILAEERLALTVYRPSALIKGVFTV
jgi:HK97 family phage major capsid protein